MDTIIKAAAVQISPVLYSRHGFGPVFTEQTEANVRQHALESGCFVVSATAWLDADQQARIMNDTGCAIEPISGGCFTAIVSPNGRMIVGPAEAGEGVVIAELDFSQSDERTTHSNAPGLRTEHERTGEALEQRPLYRASVGAHKGGSIAANPEGIRG